MKTFLLIEDNENLQVDIGKIPAIDQNAVLIASKQK